MTFKKKSQDKLEKVLIKAIQNLVANLVEETVPKQQKLKQDLCNLRENIEEIYCQVKNTYH